jgi:hypothetical protein
MNIHEIAATANDLGRQLRLFHQTLLDHTRQPDQMATADQVGDLLCLLSWCGQLATMLGSVLAMSRPVEEWRGGYDVSTN